jgi:hypothetical protein
MVGCDFRTAVTEHPLVFCFGCHGGKGDSLRQTPSRSESIKIINALGKQETGEEQTLSTCSGSRQLGWQSATANSTSTLLS